MTNRRTFLTVLAGGLLAAPLNAEAQLRKVARIGVLVPAEPESPTEPNVAAFRQALRELGYIDGQTIAVEYRYARGNIRPVQHQTWGRVVGSRRSALHGQFNPDHQTGH